MTRFITDDEQEVLRRAIERAQLDDARGERRHAALRAVVVVVIAVCALGVASFAGWYMGARP